MKAHSEARGSSSAGHFVTTHWNLVLTAREERSSHAGDALAQLCRAYWYPLYAHVRRRGQDHHAAQDLTQEFFSRLLREHWLESVVPEKGRFRSFLLAAADNFLANEWRRARAAKRGGGKAVIPLEETQVGEERYAGEAVCNGSFEREFDRRWAATVLDAALRRLKVEFVNRGKLAHFEDWKVFLTREANQQDCAASAQRLGMSPGSVAVAVHRLRERYGEILRETVAHTVADASDVEDELRHLFAILNQ